MASSTSPCAACKFLRRKCTQECVFAPYFPPDQPRKFAYVHKVFGASNVAKLLNELGSNQREDAVNSLFYEAEARLRDPVYGCVGLISILQHRLKQLQHDLENAKKELATYVGPQALLPVLQPQTHQPQHFMSLPQQTLQIPSSSSSASVLTQQHQNMLPMMAIPTGQLFMRDQQQQAIFESQQLAVAREVAREQQNEMFRAYGVGGGSNSPNHHHQNQPQVEILRFNNNFDSIPAGSVTVTGFNSGGTMSSPSLALGGSFVDSSSPQTDNSYHLQLHQQHHEAQLFVSQPQPLQTQETQTQTNSESEEGRRRVIGSSR